MTFDKSLATLQKRSKRPTVNSFKTISCSEMLQQRRVEGCSLLGAIVAKKRDPGILDPELFLAQIRKVEARLGKLAKVRKSVIN